MKSSFALFKQNELYMCFNSFNDSFNNLFTFFCCRKSARRAATAGISATLISRVQWTRKTSAVCLMTVEILSSECTYDNMNSSDRYTPRCVSLSPLQSHSLQERHTTTLHSFAASTLLATNQKRTFFCETTPWPRIFIENRR